MDCWDYGGLGSLLQRSRRLALTLAPYSERTRAIRLGRPNFFFLLFCTALARTACFPAFFTGPLPFHHLEFDFFLFSSPCGDTKNLLRISIYLVGRRGLARS